jgi:hypothetical protein
VTDIDKLRALAEQATPGPWCVRDNPDGMFEVARVGVPHSFHASAGLSVVTDNSPMTSSVRRDVEFIATANPTAVLALLDELAALRKVAEADGHMVAVARVAESLGIDEDAERQVAQALKASRATRKGRKLTPALRLTAEDLHVLGLIRNCIDSARYDALKLYAVLDRIIAAHTEQG